jgi:Fe-S-cluster containining protein
LTESNVTIGSEDKTSHFANEKEEAALMQKARPILLALLKDPSEFTEQQINNALKEAVKGIPIPMIDRHADKLCNKCGECCKQCSPIDLSDADVALLRQHLGKLLPAYVTKDDDGWRFAKTEPCAFLKDNQCSIYEYRPEMCRNYPFRKQMVLTVNYCIIPQSLVARYALMILITSMFEAKMGKENMMAFARQIQHDLNGEKP